MTITWDILPKTKSQLLLAFYNLDLNDIFPQLLALRGLSCSKV